MGYDGGKKVKGRKRYIVADTLGNLLTIMVHAANIHVLMTFAKKLNRIVDKF